MNRRCFNLLLAFATCFSAAVTAEGDLDVWSRLAAQEQASGRFLQELYGEEGELLEKSSGRYAILRPGYFRWDIDYPDRQLIVVADQVLWHYDIDLASATRRSTQEDDAFTPLELLAGDKDDLRSRFEVETLGSDRYRLVPRFPGAAFAAVELEWSDADIVAMDISDRSGQQIRLALTPDASPVVLSAQDFDFEAPEGVEVYDSMQP